mgnify:CR=1 FL=1|jgi:hypothetical protein
MRLVRKDMRLFGSCRGLYQFTLQSNQFFSRKDLPLWQEAQSIHGEK